MGGGVTVAVARRGRSTELSNVACTLGVRDKPYPEQHDRGAWTVALVRRGTFRYRAAATNRKHALRPGWLLIGRPGATYECSHDHEGGDGCASLTITEGAFDDIACTAGVSMRSLASSPPVLPPLPGAAALVERALRRPDADLDEVGYFVAESVLAHRSGAPALEVAPHPSLLVLRERFELEHAPTRARS